MVMKTNAKWKSGHTGKVRIENSKYMGRFLEK